MIKANNPGLKSWLEVNPNSDFPIQNIPFGIIRKNDAARPASRIGDYVIDLSAMADYGFFDNLKIKDLSVFYAPVLNDFIALGRPGWRAVRDRISEVFMDGNTELINDDNAKAQIIVALHDVEMMMPVEVGDYTDFYSSEEHATNVGRMFRDPDNALLPNWKHIPVGYHGRSSSIVVSGTPIHRPKGQMKADDQDKPVYGPCRLFDFELEMAFIAGGSTQLGDQIKVNEAEDFIFGMVLFNDLSARDIQKWEYVPLGPFLGKSFGSVISPWIITLDALEPFRVSGPEQDPKVLPYLDFTGNRNFNIQLDVYLQPQNMDSHLICRSNFKYMYWNMSQQLAHQTVNGCNINVGDMYASGTISGPSPDSFGSMLELSWKGTKPLKLPGDIERKFIHDFDTIVMKGYAEKDDLRIGFGEVSTQVLPAKE